MTIREMCAGFEVTPRALRYYEAMELLSPVRVGQMRKFSARDRARLKLLLKGKRFGFRLEQIRQLLNLYDEGEFIQLNETYRMGVIRLEELLTERIALEESIAELRDHLDFLGAQLNGHATNSKSV